MPKTMHVNHNGDYPKEEKDFWALAIKEDGERLICLACAEAHSHESGFPNLYFMVNRLQQEPGEMLCECGRRMGAPECLSSAKRVSDLLRISAEEPNE